MLRIWGQRLTPRDAMDDEHRLQLNSQRRHGDATRRFGAPRRASVRHIAARERYAPLRCAAVAASVRHIAARRRYPPLRCAAVAASVRHIAARRRYPPLRCAAVAASVRSRRRFAALRRRFGAQPSPLRCATSRTATLSALLCAAVAASVRHVALPRATSRHGDAMRRFAALRRRFGAQPSPLRCATSRTATLSALPCATLRHGNAIRRFAALRRRFRALRRRFRAQPSPLPCAAVAASVRHIAARERYPPLRCAPSPLLCATSRHADAIRRFGAQPSPLFCAPSPLPCATSRHADATRRFAALRRRFRALRRRFGAPGAPRRGTATLCAASLRSVAASVHHVQHSRSSAVTP
jgi:hypothetical protein